MAVKGPNGGTATAHWFDATGAPVEDPADAATGEIVETDPEIGVISRTYVDRTNEGELPIAETFSYDLQLESQDGPKGTWDVRHGMQQELVETLAELRASLGGGLDDAGWRQKLANMLQLPSWGVAPEALKAEAYAWLVETRPPH